ncbi:MAG: DUF1573 domain-containing protein, partial [Halanaerobiales bacterium]
DIIYIPAGEFTWGEDRSYININKPVTLLGSGQGETIINISTEAGGYTAGTIRLNADATVKDMTIQTSESGNSGTAFSTSVDGFRISGIEYINRTQKVTGYFAYVGSYGLIDNCDITGNTGNNELIFARGPSDSWQTEHTIGGADNLFIEDCIFRGVGYVTDINSNGRAVVRYNKIYGPMKVDGHGKCTNSPARGVRHMEIYKNHWVYNESKTWPAIEFRGGTGVIYDNVADVVGNGGYLQLRDYAFVTGCATFDGCLCPEDYPIDDQIGVGKDPKVAASHPLYLWNNKKNGEEMPITDYIGTHCFEACGEEFTLDDFIKEGRDYYILEAPLEGYEPYPYPHPLQNGETTLQFEENEDISEPRIVIPDEVWDFGEIHEGDVARETFMIQNTGNENLEVIAVKDICKCFNLLSESVIIPPGEEREIEIVYDSPGTTGYFYEDIWVVSTDPITPEIRVSIKGNILEI